MLRTRSTPMVPSGGAHRVPHKCTFCCSFFCGAAQLSLQERSGDQLRQRAHRAVAVPLNISSDFKPSLLGSALEIKLKAQWLVCRKECVSKKGEFPLTIPAKSAVALHILVFRASFAKQPKPLANNATAFEPDALPLSGACDQGAISLWCQHLTL